VLTRTTTRLDVRERQRNCYSHSYDHNDECTRKTTLTEKTVSILTTTIAINNNSKGDRNVTLFFEVTPLNHYIRVNTNDTNSPVHRRRTREY